MNSASAVLSVTEDCFAVVLRDHRVSKLQQEIEVTSLIWDTSESELAFWGDYSLLLTIIWDFQNATRYAWQQQHASTLIMN